MIRAAKPATLRSIAELVGVTPTTVSLALRNHPRISPNMRKAIQQTADEVGYRPNAELSRVMMNLKTRQHEEIRPVVALVTKGSPLSSGSMSVRGIFQGIAEQAGYALDPIGLGEPRMSFPRLADILRARNIRAALLHRVGGIAPAHDDWMDGLALCCVGPAPAGSRLPSCDWENGTPRNEALLLRTAMDLLDIHLKRHQFGPPAHALTCTLSPL